MNRVAVIGADTSPAHPPRLVAAARMGDACARAGVVVETGAPEGIAALRVILEAAGA